MAYEMFVKHGAASRRRAVIRGSFNVFISLAMIEDLGLDIGQDYHGIQMYDPDSKMVKIVFKTEAELAHDEIKGSRKLNWEASGANINMKSLLLYLKIPKPKRTVEVETLVGHKEFEMVMKPLIPSIGLGTGMQA